MSRSVTTALDSYDFYVTTEKTMESIFLNEPQPTFLRVGAIFKAIDTASVFNGAEEQVFSVINTYQMASAQEGIFATAGSVWDELFRQTFSMQEVLTTSATVVLFSGMTYDEQEVFKALHQSRSSGQNSCVIITSSQSGLRDLLVEFHYPYIIFDCNSTSSFVA